MVHDLVPLLHPEWVTPRTRSMHGYKYARTAECDLVFVNSAYTGRDVERASGRSGRPHPRLRIRVSPRSTRAAGARCRSRPAVRAQPRDARAAQEPRHARRCDAAPERRARAGGRGRGRLGRRRAARRSVDPEARLRRQRGGAGVDAGRGGLRLPVALRGLRHADRRGDGLRRPRRRLRARVDGRGVWTGSRPGRSGGPGSDRGRDPEALERRAELVAAGLEHAARFSWRACGEIHLRAFEEAA